MASDQHLLIGLPSGNPHQGIKHAFQKYPKLKSFLEKHSKNKESSATALHNPHKTYIQFDTKLENCWICEGWVECHFQIDLVTIMKQKFDFDLEMADDLDKHYLVYMHFDFDDYDADKMGDERHQSAELKGKFSVNRMVP